MVKIKLKIIVKKLLFPYYKMRYRVNTRGGYLLEDLQKLLIPNKYI